MDSFRVRRDSTQTRNKNQHRILLFIFGTKMSARVSAWVHFAINRQRNAIIVRVSAIGWKPRIVACVQVTSGQREENEKCLPRFIVWNASFFCRFFYRNGFSAISLLDTHLFVFLAAVLFLEIMLLFFCNIIARQLTFFFSFPRTGRVHVLCETYVLIFLVAIWRCFRWLILTLDGF